MDEKVEEEEEVSPPGISRDRMRMAFNSPEISLHYARRLRNSTRQFYSGKRRKWHSCAQGEHLF